jgi:hypothetical protein
MSDGVGDCYARWQVLQKDFDFLPVQNAGMMSSGSGSTETECQSSCDTTDGCIFYQFDAVSGTCSHYISPPAPAGAATNEVGFKIDVGVYSVIPGNLDSDNLGVSITTVSSDSVRNCVHECDKVEACVALVITENGPGAFTCALKSGSLSSDMKSKYKVSGARIGAWTL